MSRARPPAILILALGLGAVVLAGRGVRAAPPPTLVALTDGGALLVFTADHSEAARTVTPDVSGTLVGIDWRPADGKLWGLTDANDLYTVDPATGAATLVSSLTEAFAARTRALDCAIASPNADGHAAVQFAVPVEQYNGGRQ